MGPTARSGSGSRGVAPGIVVRRGSYLEAPALADVWLRSFRAVYDFPPAHSDEETHEWMQGVVASDAETWVAVHAASGRIVGFMILDEDRIEQLYLEPDWLRRGIGSVLVDLAKERSPGGLSLYTFEANAGARAFYERHGFVDVWHGDGSANEERQPDLRYEWSPSETGLAAQPEP